MFFAIFLLSLAMLIVLAAISDLLDDSETGIASLLIFGVGFGAMGVILQGNNFGFPASVLGGTLSGMTAIVIMGWLMRKLRGIQSDSTRRIAEVLGKQGVCTHEIPAFQVGEVEVLGHRIAARSYIREDIKSGTPIEVQQILGVNLVSVTPTGGEK